MKVKPRWQLKFELEGIRNLREDVDLPLERGNKLILKQSDSEIGIIKGHILFETEIPDRSCARKEGKTIIANEIEKLLDIVVLKSPTNLKILEIVPNPEILNEEEISRITGGYCDDLYVKEPPIEGNLMDGYLKDAVRLKQRIEKTNEIDVYRITKWFRRGMNTRGEDKFIMLWISFNALYGYNAKKNKKSGKVAEQIESLFKVVSDEQEIVDLVNRHRDRIDELSNADLISLYGTNRSEDLKKALKDQDNREILKKTALCIYNVRNDLFHGGISPASIDSCTLILQDMIKSITKEIIQKYTKRLEKP